MFGGIDLGGTKIEAALFDSNFGLINAHRVTTPSSYGALVDALVAQYDWLRDTAGVRQLPLGIGIPGVVDRASGLSVTANLPATGMPLIADLSNRLGFSVPFENDCKCFALSEANGGAADGYETAFGLILGTGCGGGVCHHGALVLGRNGLPGEVGHFGLPMELAMSLNLPHLRCGCGRSGCYETLISGLGMSALAWHLTKTRASPEQIAVGAANQDDAMGRVFSVWLEIACELLHTIQLTIDPDCVVLGGGLSRIDGIAAKLSQRFALRRVEGIAGPEIVAARFGDSSGVRGAAMLALPDRGVVGQGWMTAAVTLER